MSACHISLFIWWHSDSISKDQKGGAFFRKPSASKCDLLDTMVYKRRNKCCNKKDKVFFHSFAAVFIPRANTLSCLLSFYCTSLPLQAVQMGPLGERLLRRCGWEALRLLLSTLLTWFHPCCLRVLICPSRWWASCSCRKSTALCFPVGLVCPCMSAGTMSWEVSSFFCCPVEREVSHLFGR